MTLYAEIAAREMLAHIEKNYRARDPKWDGAVAENSDLARWRAALNRGNANMTGKVTESIYSGKSTVVPLADVQHIEKRELGLVVVTKHTRWDNDGDFWANSIWIDKAEAESFMRAWCGYRSELEADTLADLSPTDEPSPYRDRTPPLTSPSETGAA